MSNFIKHLLKCNACFWTGVIKNIGSVAWKVTRKYYFNRVNILTWISQNKHVSIVLLLSIITFLIWPSTLPISIFTDLGAIYLALRYKLDKSTYQKSLFEERYAIFLKIDYMLAAALRGTDKENNPLHWQHFSTELDNIYRKSYFLFSKKLTNF